MGPKSRINVHVTIDDSAQAESKEQYMRWNSDSITFLNRYVSPKPQLTYLSMEFNTVFKVIEGSEKNLSKNNSLMPSE